MKSVTIVFWISSSICFVDVRGQEGEAHLIIDVLDKAEDESSRASRVLLANSSAQQDV